MILAQLARLAAHLTGREAIFQLFAHQVSMALLGHTIGIEPQSAKLFP